MGCVSLSISLMYLFSLLLLPQHIQQNSCRRRERRLFIHQALECFTAIFKDYFCVAVTVWPVSDKDGDDNYSACLLGSRCSVSDGRAKNRISTAFLHLFFQVKLGNIYNAEDIACFFFFFAADIYLSPQRIWRAICCCLFRCQALHPDVGLRVLTLNWTVTTVHRCFCLVRLCILIQYMYYSWTNSFYSNWQKPFRAFSRK